MAMTVVELEKIMIEKCIAIRAIPKEVRGIYKINQKGVKIYEFRTIKILSY